MFRFLTFRAKYEGDDDDGNDYTLRRQKIIENLSKSRRFLASYNYQQQHQQHSWFLGRLPHLHHTITIYLSLSNLTSYNDVYFASLVVAWEKIFWELLSLSRHLHLRKNFNNFQRRWLRLCHYHPISIVLPLPISLSLSLSHTHTNPLTWNIQLTIAQTSFPICFNKSQQKCCSELNCAIFKWMNECRVKQL